MNHKQHLIATARVQYETFGLINTSIIARLSALGVDVPQLERSFEEEMNG